MGEGDQKTILLVWGYDRVSWITPLLKLEGKAEIHLLFHFFKPEKDHSLLNGQIHYWSDFRNAQVLLRKINPDKVVFMALDSPLVGVLNTVCKKVGITTVVLQHGMFHSFELYKEQQTRSRSIASQEGNQVDSNALRKGILSFVLSSIRWYNLRFLVDQFKVSWFERSMTKIEAKTRVLSNNFIADTYLVYSKYNARIFTIRDGVDPSKMSEVGMPEMDGFVAANKKYSINENDPYLLLIDFPMAEVKKYGTNGLGYTKDQVNLYYSGLSQFAKKIGCKLKIKLHPYSYDSSFFEVDENVELLRETDLTELIFKAKYIIGSVSSAMIPAVLYRKTALIRVFENSDFIDYVVAKGLANAISVEDAVNGTVPQDLFIETKKETKSFESDFVFKADGNSTDRLINALLL